MSGKNNTAILRSVFSVSSAFTMLVLLLFGNGSVRGAVMQVAEITGWSFLGVSKESWRPCMYSSRCSSRCARSFTWF